MGEGLEALPRGALAHLSGPSAAADGLPGGGEERGPGRPGIAAGGAAEQVRRGRDLAPLGEARAIAAGGQGGRESPGGSLGGPEGFPHVPTPPPGLRLISEAGDSRNSEGGRLGRSRGLGARLFAWPGASLSRLRGRFF